MNGERGTSPHTHQHNKYSIYKFDENNFSIPNVNVNGRFGGIGGGRGR